MRILVTGAKGFVGRHLARELVRSGHTPLLLDLEPAKAPADGPIYVCDLRNASSLKTLIGEIKPDACIHLGGIAFVPLGWSDPELVFSVNVGGTVNLLESFRAACPTARILVVTSAEVYGRSPSATPFTEETPMMPSNLYAVSKMAADLTVLLYARRYAMPVMTARPENHIGPQQSPRFVTTAFAGQAIRIARGEAEPVMRVGNLDSERDFTDVRDVARAYRLLIERGRPGEAYNIASGQPVRIRVVLDELCRIAGIKPEIKVDPTLFRPTDNSPSVDSSKIRLEVGWKTEIPLSETLRDIYLDMTQRPAAAT